MKISYGISAFLLLTTLSACNRPLETNLPNAAQIQSNTFRIAKTVDNPSSAYIYAAKFVQENLEKKGFRQSDDGQIYITIAVSSRKSDSSISTKADDQKVIVSNTKKKGFLKFCNDSAIKLSVIMQDINNGQSLYNGSATQRRCDINEKNSMKHLAQIATSSLLPRK